MNKEVNEKNKKKFDMSDIKKLVLDNKKTVIVSGDPCRGAGAEGGHGVLSCIFSFILLILFSICIDIALKFYFIK